MKNLFIITLLILTSCNSNTKDNANTTDEAIEAALLEPKTEFNLIDTVLKNLNINKENCKLDLVAVKESPNNADETIFAIPEIANRDTEDDTYFEYNNHILIVDTNTGEIKQKYFETAKTNGWISDAVNLAKIKIDSVPYKISGKESAFGIRVGYHNNSQVNPYSYETISLFKKKDSSLLKILNNYKVIDSHGQLDSLCYADFISNSKKLIMSRGNTNVYFNILVKNTITKTTRRPDYNEDCIDTNEITTEVLTLRFNDSEYKESKEQDLILATIDSVSLAQIKQYSKPFQSIYDYYNYEIEDNIEIWSDKMFGRCCSEADLNYSELLDFEIGIITKNKDYFDSNLSDQTYRTAFVFKEDESVKITLRLLKTSDNHKYHTDLHIDDVLKSNDTILKPFRLSLVNGDVKSKALFEKNGSVKTLEIYLNKEYKNTILLQDTPLVQEFYIDFPFFKNDVITLIPQSYYKGTTNDDICISEIQSSLAEITHPSLNKKYKIRDIRKD